MKGWGWGETHGERKGARDKKPIHSSYNSEKFEGLYFYFDQRFNPRWIQKMCGIREGAVPCLFNASSRVGAQEFHRPF